MTVFKPKSGMKNSQNQTKEGSNFKIKFKVKSDDPTQIALRRWLIMEIYCGRISVQHAIEEFDFEHKLPSKAIKDWQALYAPDIPLSLPIMTERERHKIESLEKHIKKVEKRLEEAQMKVTSLDTLIDIAESKLNVSIRKKSGTKQ